jgi:hypothetical protein
MAAKCILEMSPEFYNDAAACTRPARALLNTLFYRNAPADAYKTIAACLGPLIASWRSAMRSFPLGQLMPVESGGGGDGSDPDNLHPLWFLPSWWRRHVDDSGACALILALQRRSLSGRPPYDDDPKVARRCRNLCHDLCASPLAARRLRGAPASGVPLTTPLHEAAAAGLTLAVAEMADTWEVRGMARVVRRGGIPKINDGQNFGGKAQSVVWYNGSGESPLVVAARCGAAPAAGLLLGELGPTHAFAPTVPAAKARVAFAHLGVQAEAAEREVTSALLLALVCVLARIASVIDCADRDGWAAALLPLVFLQGGGW